MMFVDLPMLMVWWAKISESWWVTHCCIRILFSRTWFTSRLELHWWKTWICFWIWLDHVGFGQNRCILGLKLRDLKSTFNSKATNFSFICLYIGIHKSTFVTLIQTYMRSLRAWSLDTSIDHMVFSHAKKGGRVETRISEEII